MPVRENPALAAKIAQMATPLRPLVRVTNGQQHPSFPLTVLNFHLLTSEQCDELAHHFHQRTPCEWTGMYPMRIEWRNDAPLDQKRRRIGRFIGLRGCESPLVVKTEEEIERDARRARDRDDDEIMKRKLRWYN